MALHDLAASRHVRSALGRTPSFCRRRRKHFARTYFNISPLTLKGVKQPREWRREDARALPRRIVRSRSRRRVHVVSAPVTLAL